MPHPTAPDRTGATATIANPHSTPPPMTVILKKPQTGSVPLHVVDAAGFAAASGALSPMQRQWLATLGFQGAPATHALLPGDDGRLAAVWAGARVGNQYTHPNGNTHCNGNSHRDTNTNGHQYADCDPYTNDYQNTHPHQHSDAYTHGNAYCHGNTYTHHHSNADGNPYTDHYLDAN